MRALIALAVVLTTLSCTDGKKYRLQSEEILIQSGNGRQSSAAGNLMASAIKHVHNLDVVMYPTALIPKEQRSIASKTLSTFETNHLLAMFPQAVKDQMMIGVMSGRSLKKFIADRTSETYAVELEVAGIEYDISYIGGIQQYADFSRERNLKLEDDKQYRVAVSKFFFFAGATFPGYKYRNGFNFSFKDSGKVISARDSLREYLASGVSLPFLKEVRARVRRKGLGDAGVQTIPAIQGSRHRSPFYGHTVTTRGIVTATGGVPWYPGGVDAYIQTAKDDGDPTTSEALHVYLDDENQDLKLGDLIEVSGTVYEQITSSGLGRTSIREVTKLTTLERGVPLPPTIQLVREGQVESQALPFTRRERARSIPTRVISSFRGNLNLKPDLTLTDGIDFWESLEGMRVQIDNPKIVGFRGGQEDFENLKPKTYLNLYLITNAERSHKNKTTGGGVIVDHPKNDYNPEIVQLVTNHLTFPFETEKIFNIGTVIPGTLEGVLAYERNLFGDGEYTLVLPEVAPAMKAFADQAGTAATPLAARPQTTLVPSPDHLTLASMNIENLAGYQKRRIEKLSEAILVNMKCPDILNLVEIQDGNGMDFSSGSSAEETLRVLVAAIQCPGVDYRPVNIDPINNSEGGEPGGNIRVAMLYNANRVGFEKRGNAGSLEETIIRPDGSLRVNPGRVFPNHEVFSGTRRSLIAEFTFKGQRLFVIGNHFNSKLGDRSHWSAIQPPMFDSERRRDLLADKINDFVEMLALMSPSSNVIVAGDFNALISEDSMNVLEGEHLRNMISIEGKIPPAHRYTTNHNGNSQPLDYIFANHVLLAKEPEIEVLHINSDYMGRLSDHDPLVARFRF